MPRRPCRACCILLIAAFGIAELSVHLRAQTSSTPRVAFAQLPALGSVVWPGDFNGDGITDLAATAPTDHRVVVAIGVGDGHFRVPVPTSFTGRVLGVGDFNDDARKDLIVDSQPFASGGIAILPGNGDGTFGTARTVGVYDSATFVLTGDFDGDGKRDLVVGAEPDILDVYPGNNDLTFGPQARLVTGLFPQGGAAADLNGDGRKDIIVANRYSDSLTIFLNHGSLVFTPTDLRLERSPTDVIATDLNGDGRVDLAAAVRTPSDGRPDFDEGYAYVFTGNGDGTFSEPAKFRVPNGAFRIVAGDFTRDGRVDLATLNDSFTYRDDCAGVGGADSVTILPGTGGGSFGAAASFALSGFQNSALSLNTSDLNHDGSTDLIVSNGTILFTKAPGANAPPTVNAGPDEIRVADREVVLHATASDPDGDWLTYVWTLEDGSTIAHSNPCVSGLSDGPHTFTVTVDDGHGHQTSDSVTYTIYSEAPPARPDAFVGRDIGAVGAAGQSTYDGTRFTVSGSGADIWNAADEFQFASQTISGNFVLTVHVDSVQNVDSWTKAGLMIREDLGAASRHASVFASSGKGIAFQRRPLANGTSVSTPGAPTTAPVWLKLVRDGDVISSYWRKTTTDFWTLIGRQTLSGLAGAVQAGLAVTSHHDGLLATAVFSSLSAVPTPTWTPLTVGSATGSATLDGALFTVNGSGADIWNAEDAFQFVSTSWRGDDAVMTARVRNVENTHDWAKAGVMFRQLLTPGSMQVDLFVTPGRGVAMQYRAATGATTDNVAVVPGAAPEWLRLTRHGSMVEGSMSRDGMTWSAVGSLSIDFGGDLNVGLAVTSHNRSTEATAVFDDVSLTP
jgi:regulation of enolase protein 1 (concanavalin A-like superfamily)